MTNAELYTYLTAIPAVAICAILLVGIGLLVTRAERAQLIPEHSTVDRYWYRQRPVGEGPTEALRAHRPRHLDAEDITPSATGPEMEQWPTVGRRSVTSPVRHLPVSDDWTPVMGALRIALLETHTAEYLFVRKPHDQLNTTTPRFIRSYMYAG